MKCEQSWSPTKSRLGSFSERFGVPKFSSGGSGILSPITEFRPPPFHIYRRFSWSCTSHPSTSHLHPTKITHDLFPPRTPRSARIRVAVAYLAALMLNVYSSGPAHASQKILVSTAGNAFIANPAISNPDAVSS